jgi:hypothetical protein
MSTVLSIKLSESEKERLRQAARKRKVSMSSLLKEGLAVVLEGSESGQGVSCYHRSSELFEAPGHIGASGLGDLSHNKKHLRGFGK